MAAIFPQGSAGIFCTHVQGECDVVSIFILCILIQMNICIHLRHCFRKLDSYSVRLHDTNVLPEFKYLFNSLKFVKLCRWKTFLNRSNTAGAWRHSRLEAELRVWGALKPFLYINYRISKSVICLTTKMRSIS